MNQDEKKPKPRGPRPRSSRQQEWIDAIAKAESPLSSQELATKFGVTESAAAQMVARLKKEGVIKGEGFRPTRYTVA